MDVWHFWKVFGLLETQNCSMSARDAGPNLVTIQDGFVKVQVIKTTSGLIEVKSIWFRKSFHFWQSPPFKISVLKCSRSEEWNKCIQSPAVMMFLKYSYTEYCFKTTSVYSRYLDVLSRCRWCNCGSTSTSVGILVACSWYKFIKICKSEST